MSERNRITLVFAILIVVSIWGYFSIFEGKDKKARQSQPSVPATSSPIEPGIQVESAADASLSDELIAQLHAESWGKDPFYHDFSIPEATPQVTEEVSLHLLGIVYRELNARALINGQVLKEGDFLDKYKIIKIAPDYVDLESGGKTITLRVEKESS